MKKQNILFNENIYIKNMKSEIDFEVTRPVNKIRMSIKPDKMTNEVISYNFISPSCINCHMTQTCKFKLSTKNSNSLLSVPIKFNDLLKSVTVILNGCTFIYDIDKILPLIQRTLTDSQNNFNSYPETIEKQERFENDETIFDYYIETTEPVISNITSMDYNQTLSNICNFKLFFNIDNKKVKMLKTCLEKYRFNFDFEMIDASLNILMISSSNPKSNCILNKQKLQINQYQVFQTKSNSLKNIESKPIMLNPTPKFIICYLDDNFGQLFPISKLNINFDTYSGQVIDSKELFRMAVSNGYNDNYLSWVNESLCILDSSEFNLNAFQIEGKMNIHNIQIYVETDNKIGRELNLNIIIVDPSLLILENGMTTCLSGIIENSDIKKSYSK